MTAIKIQKFGGIAPSVDPRNLPAEGAQTAQNIDLRFGDFRPTRGLSSPLLAVPGGTRSIFRTPSGVWLHSTTDTDYVNGQIPDATAERVYLTGRGAYPEAWQDGSYRRLGVPRPAAKPVVELESVDEFTNVDATAAQELAKTAVLDLVESLDSQIILGTESPSGSFTAVVAPDALYPQVALHMRFTAWPFVDSSPQRRAVVTESGVAHGTDTSGPLGASGTGYALLTGGTAGGLTFPEIRRWPTDGNPRWTMDFWIKPDVTLEELSIESRGSNMREITCIAAGGQFKTLTASGYGGAFSTQWRGRRPNGAAICNADTACLISVQCTGTTVQVFVDGQFCGQTPTALGLEASIVGRSFWTNSRPFTGKIDEVRVTLEQRYTGSFTPTATPFPDQAAPTGLFAPHGTAGVTGLPTVDERDTAYLIPVTLVNGNYVAVNTADAYLLDGSLGGSLVTYSATPYWAVPVSRWREYGKTISESALTAALTALVDPSNPPTLLLTPTQAADLADDIERAYTGADVTALVSALNSAQAEFRAALANSSTTAATLLSRRTAITTAAEAIEEYFATLRTEIGQALSANASAIFGAIIARTVTQLFETRAYIVTYISDWGEESGASLPSDLLDVDQNDIVNITVPTPPVGRNIVGYRIYRSSSGDATSAYKLIDGTGAENALSRDGAFWAFDISTLRYKDQKRQEELQEPCETLRWDEPPENLRGLVGLPNGIMAGFFGKTLCFSVPDAPYAWPKDYQLSLEYDIVGIGVFGQTAVVLTEGFPYYVSGADSATMSAQKIENPQSCIAKRTIVSSEAGVVFASPDGLCIAGPQGVEVTTLATFSKKDWLDTVGEDSFGAYSDGRYILFTDL